MNCLNKVKCVAMGDYYGKLAFLWEEGECNGETKYVQCKMIDMDKPKKNYLWDC